MFAAIKFGDVIVIATMVVTEIETVIVTGFVTWIATLMGRPFQLRLHLRVIGSNSDYTFESLVPTPIETLGRQLLFGCHALPTRLSRDCIIVACKSIIEKYHRFYKNLLSQYGFNTVAIQHQPGTTVATPLQLTSFHCNSVATR
jgi:hypothetical protein